MFQQNDPRLAAVCLLLKRFGDRIEGGGFEVKVKHTEMVNMSPYGTFREVPEQDGIRWQYFPNVTIDVPKEDYKISDATESVALIEKKDADP